MATFRQGIPGGFSGKVGTVVGSTWKSINYMRALAVNVHDAKSEKQLCQRGKFRTVVNFTKTITPFLRVGFQEHEEGRSAVNAATSYLMLHAVEGCADDATLNFDKVRVSQGSLTAATDATVQVAAGKATFSWTDNSDTGDAQATDTAMALAYNKDRQEAVYRMAIATRADGTAELTLPTNWDGEALAIYLAFCSADGQHVSNSLCLQNDAPSTAPGGSGGEDEDDGDHQLG